MDADADIVFETVSRRLPAAGVACVMIGGHAVNHYGVSRATLDIDFMIAAEDDGTVRQVMLDAGFSNIAGHDNVTFYNRPGSPLRVDFLKVDRATMDSLLANATEVEYFERHRLAVPRLHDLLAMKIFALAQGGARREEKDFADIVNLVIEHALDVETDLAPLCRQFGDEPTFGKLASRIRELRHA